MPNTLVAINEDFSKMIVGRNSSLSYIVVALQRGEDVFIHNLPKNPAPGQAFPSDPTASIAAIHIDPKSPFAQQLVAAYISENEKLVDVIEHELRERKADKTYPYGIEIAAIEKMTVAEMMAKAVVAEKKAVIEAARKGIFEIKKELWEGRATPNSHAARLVRLEAEQKKLTQLEKEYSTTLKALPENPALTTKERIDLQRVDNVVQRLEPMNAPFPPQGKENFDVALESMQASLPGKKFNAPIRLCDKENKKMNAKLKAMEKEEISTPTEEFKLDQDFPAALHSMFAKSVEMFPGSKARIVLKPQYSAQSCGVCAIEIDDEKGMTLAELKSKSIGELAEHQSYSFKSGLLDAEMKEMAEILLYVQRLVTDPQKLAAVAKSPVGEISREEIQSSAAELYKDGILAQPFLQGVKKGDIRANIVKDENGNFVLHGYTYRASARAEDSKGFTTCYTTGAATSAPVEFLSELEQENLKKVTATFLELLNEDPEYRAMYENSMEIGVDFVPVGDAKGSIVHGETNHTCPALGPISSALTEANDRIKHPEKKAEYDCLKYPRVALDAQLAAQEAECHSAKSPKTSTVIGSTPLQLTTGKPADQQISAAL